MFSVSQLSNNNLGTASHHLPIGPTSSHYLGPGIVEQHHRKIAKTNWMLRDFTVDKLKKRSKKLHKEALDSRKHTKVHE